MLISLSWLEKYVDIPVDTRTLINDLTMLGLNVERVMTIGVDTDLIVVGRVMDVARHPNADRLSLCKVDTGTGDILDIVCGATNVAAGQSVLVATTGAKLPNGIKIKKSKIRGVVSNGMICSETELGLGDDASGIIVLDRELPPGTQASEVIGAANTILDIEVTPNRPDQLCHIGVAREVGALYSIPVRYPYKEIDSSGDSGLSIDIKDPADCYRYVGRIVEGISVGPSPAWLRDTLEGIGINSVNNVVDISNYVLMETGQPLHVFDVDKLGGLDVGIRRARAGEKIKALDDVEYTLDESCLLITQDGDPVAIAGVIGGLETAVTEDTSNILIESAAFDPRVVRKTRKFLNNSTEASYRFERGSDRDICRTASDRAVELITEMAGGTVGTVTDAFPAPLERKSVKIRCENTRRILGVGVEGAEIEGFLKRLHFDIIDNSPKEITVAVPSFRGDIVEEMDLIEEVARMYGYERIGQGWGFRTTTYAKQDDFDGFCEEIADGLAARGYTEALTSSFSDGSEVDLMGWEPSDSRKRLISIKNPLTSNQTYLKTSPLPAVLEIVRRNIDHGTRRMNLFSVTKVFVPAEEETRGSGSSGLPEESVMLVIIRTQPGSQDFWNHSKRNADLFDIKAETERIAAAINVDIVSRLTYEFHRGAGRFEYKDREDTVIEGGIVPAKLAARYDIEQAVWYTIVDMEKFFRVRASRSRFKAVSEFPVSKRDLSLVTAANVTFGQIEKCLVRHGSKLLESVNVFDVYDGESVSGQGTAYGVRLYFRSAERTLRDAEIDGILEKMLRKLQSELGVTLRT